MRVSRVALLLLAFLSALVTSACAPEPVRVTVVGIDGGNWGVIDPMLEKGELPNLARLIDAGVRGPLQSELPLNSPPIWTTVATGRNREHHGIMEFRKDGRLVSSRDRQVPAIWTITSAKGLRTTVIGWWGTFPAEPIDGVVISERALKTREADIAAMFRGRMESADPLKLTYPPEVLAMLASIFASKPGPEPGEPKPMSVKANMRIEDAACIEALLELRRERGPFDLEMVLLRGVDPVSHFFWKYHEPGAKAYRRPSPKEIARFGDTVRAHYRFVDAQIGKLWEADSERVFVIVSDHGFEPGRQRFRGGNVLSGTHKSEAASQGIFIASGGPIRRGGKIEDVTIYDVAPLALYLLKVPIADDLEGKIPMAIFDPKRASEPERVARYDIPANSLPAGESSDGTSPADELLLDELKALGYIE